MSQIIRKTSENCGISLRKSEKNAIMELKVIYVACIIRELHSG